MVWHFHCDDRRARDELCHHELLGICRQAAGLKNIDLLTLEAF